MRKKIFAILMLAMAFVSVVALVGAIKFSLLVYGDIESASLFQGNERAVAKLTQQMINYFLVFLVCACNIVISAVAITRIIKAEKQKAKLGKLQKQLNEIEKDTK